MIHLFQEPKFWSAVSFVLFFVVFGKKIWRPLAAAMDDRAIKIKQDIEEASRLRREAEEIYTLAKKEHEAAKAEAQRMIEASKEAAARIAEEAKKDAEEFVSRNTEMVKVRLASSEQEAIKFVRHQVADIAIKAAHDAIAMVLTEEKDRVLVDRAIADLPKMFAKDRYAS